jgi:hypothetical protein
VKTYRRNGEDINSYSRLEGNIYVSNTGLKYQGMEDPHQELKLSNQLWSLGFHFLKSLYSTTNFLFQETQIRPFSWNIKEILQNIDSSFHTWSPLQGILQRSIKINFHPSSNGLVHSLWLTLTSCIGHFLWVCLVSAWIHVWN